MQLSERFSGIEQNIAQAQLDTVLLECTRADELRRPFYLLRPRIYPDGDQWCALLGENLQEGVAGFGDSPHLASQAFDNAWFGTELKGAK